MKDLFAKAELFRLFFILIRGYYFLSALFSLYLGIRGFDVVGIFLTFVAISILGGQFYASFVAERLVSEKSIWGTFLGLLLALMALPGLAFPISILGFYALLNVKHRETYYPEELPVWFASCLKKLDEVTRPVKA